jgi:toxin-antitoxin system PIN domain toxin
LVDANVMLYAVNTDSKHHEASRTWMDRALSGHEPVGFAWIALMAFIRISTHAAVFSAPMTVREAVEQVQDWTGAPNASVVNPRLGHLAQVSTLLETTGTGGNLANDAHLAALALDRGATVITFDNDFSRFPGVKWITPTAGR